MAKTYSLKYEEDILIGYIKKIIPAAELKDKSFSRRTGPFIKLSFEFDPETVAEIFYCKFSRRWTYDKENYSPELSELCEKIGTSFTLEYICYPRRNKSDPGYSIRDVLKTVENYICIFEVGDKVSISYSGCHYAHLSLIYHTDQLTVKEVIRRETYSEIEFFYILEDTKGKTPLDVDEESPYNFIASELEPIL